MFFKRRSVTFLFTALLLVQPLDVLAQTEKGSSHAKPLTQRALDISLEPVIENGVLHFKVDMLFAGSATDESKIVLPNVAGQERLFDAIKNLHIIGTDAAVHDTDKPQIKRLTYGQSPGQNQTVHIQYDLMQDFVGPAVNKSAYRVLLQPEYFHWLGRAAWILPYEDEFSDIVFNIHLHWNNLPKDWTLANSFAVNQREQNFSATPTQFVSSVFVGGDFRVNTALVNGKPIHTAIRGKWSFTDAEFTGLLQTIVSTERNFWETDDPYFLVTMIPVSDIGSIRHGRALTSTFSLFNTQNTELKDLTWLLSHEYFHNWNPKKLGAMPQDETTMYWLSEGFTDYYANVLLLRNGLSTLDAFLARYNTLLKNTYLSPVRSEPNARIAKDFWHDSYVQKLPYQRGDLLATEWNAQIRTASGGKFSLDNVMHDMADAALKSADAPLTLSPERINSFVQRYTLSDSMPLINKHIEQGELIVPSANWFGPYVEMVWEEMPLFELGFDQAQYSHDGMIGGVILDSAAYRAGLRDGQKPKQALFQIGNPSQWAEFIIKEGDVERTIRYLPQSATTVRVPQFRLPATLSADQRYKTLQWLGVSSVVSENK